MVKISVIEKTPSSYQFAGHFAGGNFSRFNPAGPFAATERHAALVKAARVMQPPTRQIRTMQEAKREILRQLSADVPALPSLDDVIEEQRRLGLR
jgi:hypothetical protein